MSSVSLITITKDNLTDFQDCFLPFVTDYSDQFSDVVVVDSSLGQDIETLSSRHSLNYVRSDPGRGLQLSLGAKESIGDWLLFLHSDTRLAGDWQSQINGHIESDGKKAAVFQLSFNTKNLGASTVASWANFRTRFFILPYGDQGLLISKELYDSIGGFDPNLPLMEDVDLIKRLGKQSIRLLKATALTSGAKYNAEGWLKRSLKHFKFFLLYRSGESVREIYQDYYR